VVAFPAAGVEHRASRIRATGGRSLLDGATVLAAVEHRHERRLGTVGGAVHPQGNCRAGTARPSGGTRTRSPISFQVTKITGENYTRPEGPGSHPSYCGAGSELNRA
jgi:hypothetical protein